MFNTSPISKTQQELVQAARAATTDYMQNGTDLTEAVVKAASAIQPLTSEHVRRICEMTYHDAYERAFAEKTGMLQYVSFDPPDAIRAAEMLDALQLGLNQQHNFSKLASNPRGKHMTKQASVRNRLYSLFTKEAMTSKEVRAKNKKIGREIGKISEELKKTPDNKDLIARKNALIEEQKTLPNVRDLEAKERAAAAEAESKKPKTNAAGGPDGGPGVFGEDKAKQEAEIKAKADAKAKAEADALKKTQEEAAAAAKKVEVDPADAKKTTGFFGGMSGRNKMLLGGAGLLGAAGLGYGAYRAGQSQQPKPPSIPQTQLPPPVKLASMPRKFKRMNTHEIWTKAASGTELPYHNPTLSVEKVHRDLKDSISTVKSELYAAEHTEKLAMIDMVKQAKAGLSAGHSMEQVLHAALSVVDASEPLMAKTAHDLCATIIEACADHQNSGFRKEASKDKKKKPFFKRLAANTVEAVSDPYGISHLQSKRQKERSDRIYKQMFGKEAQAFMSQKEYMDKAKRNSKGWKKNPMKLIYNFEHKKKAAAFTEDEHKQLMGWYRKQLKANPNNKAMRNDYESLRANKKSLVKKAAALQEVNPNHPIPQKFRKLAEANIQRKHLEVTLDELNRNMDYFNEKIKDELTR